MDSNCVFLSFWSDRFDAVNSIAGCDEKEAGDPVGRIWKYYLSDMQDGHDRRPALLGSFFLIILLSYLLPLTVCLILQVFDETCSNVLHSLLGIAPTRFTHTQKVSITRKFNTTS